MTDRKIMLLQSLCALLTGTAQVLFGETHEGAGTFFGAHLQRPALVLSPATNGVQELTCTVGLLGGCCFPLTSHNVTAKLDIPSSLSLLDGPSPTNYPVLEAPTSGTPKVWATFRWHLRRNASEAVGQLTVTVSSEDSGQVAATHSLSKESRIKISGPSVPETFPAKEKMDVVVEAACLDEDRYLKSVRFWYSSEISSDAVEVDIPPGLEEKGMLRFTVNGHQTLVQGIPVDLTRKHEPILWRGALAMPKNGTVHGVAVATDDTGRTACGTIVSIRAPAPTAQQADRRDYPPEGSVAVYLFLDAGMISRQLAEQLETYRRAAPHRIHLLCFVEGTTPDSLMKTCREDFGVACLPSVVFDAKHCVVGTNTVALTGTLDRCFNKPASRLSMELHGGVIAGEELSLGFILCNHAFFSEVRGSLTVFSYESNIDMGGWRCDRVVRQRLEEDRPYAVPSKKCLPPTMLKWKLPKGVLPAQTGALILIMDETGKIIDSICTEKPCGRTGICG